MKPVSEMTPDELAAIVRRGLRAGGPGAAEDDAAEALDELVRRAQLGAILSAEVYVEPCHTTGEHDPTHTPRAVCYLQIYEMAKRIIVALGLDKEQLPRRLHENCYWCEEGSKRHQELVEWANARPTSLGTDFRAHPDELEGS